MTTINIEIENLETTDDSISKDYKEALSEYSEEAILEYCAYFGVDASEFELETFEDVYRGEWYSEEDFAEDFLTEMGYLDKLPRGFYEHWIDWERVARDLFITDFYFENGYVFARN